MRDIFFTEETTTTPQIKLDSENGVISLKGRIITVDCEELFKPIFNWLNSYINSPAIQTQIQIHLDYFNTVATKYLLYFFNEIKTQLLPDNEIKILWFYDIDDEDMLEIAQDFQTVISIPFEIIQAN